MSKDTLEYPINMTPEVAKYWYDRFLEFHQSNAEFSDITFADYLGNQVLSSMMLIFKGQVLDEEPETTEAGERKGGVDES